ncbi:MAG: chemotaxis protein CheB [Deltaproteobacteria bacterium]|nr:chemotaxis protein CheB [Deltaproteobacteria bacterium]
MPRSVLIVDDSPTARLALKRALEGSELQVVGAVATGGEALESVERLRPDIVTMDLFLGKDDGVEVTRSIMERCPTPILVVTSADTSDAELSFRIVGAGALDVFPKLPGAGHAEYERQRRQLIRRLQLLSEVPVVTRHRREERERRHRRAPPAAPVPREPRGLGERSEAPTLGLRVGPHPNARLIVIGASTGGPPELERLLSRLPAPYPLPIVLVQHISEGFAGPLADWLSTSTGHRVVVAERSLFPEPGLVILAPDDRHLVLTSSGRLQPTSEEVPGHNRPSIDHFFSSVAATQPGGTLGILLTGMGRDGARGLAALKRAGGITIVQDPDSALLSSMPRAALEEEPTALVAEPGRIADYLRDLEV